MRQDIAPTSVQEGSLEGELCTLLPDRETLMWPIFPVGIIVAPVINVDPVIVVGNAIAVQAGTIGSYLSATLIQNLHF